MSDSEYEIAEYLIYNWEAIALDLRSRIVPETRSWHHTWLFREGVEDEIRKALCADGFLVDDVLTVVTTDFLTQLLGPNFYKLD